jgi:hypothetical protein
MRNESEINVANAISLVKKLAPRKRWNEGVAAISTTFFIARIRENPLVAKSMVAMPRDSCYH